LASSTSIPRSVMVDYLKVLIAFHLGLYHLRLLKLLPTLVRRRGADSTCATGACPVNPKSPDSPFGDCPYRVGMLVDVAGQPGTPLAALAERSSDTHYRRIPTFVRAYFATKKLDEFATEQDTVVLVGPPSLGLSVTAMLLAATEVVIPVALTYLALDGCAEVARTVERVASEHHRPGLRVTAVVPMMHRRTALAEAVRERLEAYFPGRVTPPLGVNVAIDEAQSHGKTVWDYAPRSRGAQMMTAVAEAVWALGEAEGLP
jgi:hypothetical protein